MKKFFSVSILFAEVLIWTISLLIICVTSSTSIVFAAMASSLIVTILLEETVKELKHNK